MSEDLDGQTGNPEAVEIVQAAEAARRELGLDAPSDTSANLDATPNGGVETGEDNNTKLKEILELEAGWDAWVAELKSDPDRGLGLIKAGWLSEEFRKAEIYVATSLAKHRGAEEEPNGSIEQGFWSAEVDDALEQGDRHLTVALSDLLYGRDYYDSMNKKPINSDIADRLRQQTLWFLWKDLQAEKNKLTGSVPRKDEFKRPPPINTW